MGAPAAAQLSISASFDSGNIEVLGVEHAGGDTATATLAIRPDPFCGSDGRAHYQWFHFQVTQPAPGKQLVLRIANAGGSSYPEAWQDYKAVASYDCVSWFRVQDTTYDAASGTLTIRHTPEAACVRYAYWAPFDLERHTRLVMSMQRRPRVQLHVLGQSLDGRDIHMLQVGSPAPHKATIWVIARQHPGEPMAEWFAEGLLERLAPGPPIEPVVLAAGSSSTRSSGEPDAEVLALLEQAVVYVVPCVCPDGAVRGHLRTNACGANLNREWSSPAPGRSPEVLAVSEAIAATGLHFLLDVHGDEEIPANFIGSMFGVPAWGVRLERMQKAFVDALLAASPDFQTELGYPLPPPNGANLSTASKANAQRYNTLSLVLEQPFKDNRNTPNPATGWSPERAKAFGAAHVTAFLHTVPTLLAERGTRDTA